VILADSITVQRKEFTCYLFCMIRIFVYIQLKKTIYLGSNAQYNEGIFILVIQNETLLYLRPV